MENTGANILDNNNVDNTNNNIDNNTDNNIDNNTANNIKEINIDRVILCNDYANCVNILNNNICNNHHVYCGKECNLLPEDCNKYHIFANKTQKKIQILRGDSAGYFRAKLYDDIVLRHAINTFENYNQTLLNRQKESNYLPSSGQAYSQCQNIPYYYSCKKTRLYRERNKHPKHNINNIDEEIITADNNLINNNNETKYNDIKNNKLTPFQKYLLIFAVVFLIMDIICLCYMCIYGNAAAEKKINTVGNYIYTIFIGPFIYIKYIITQIYCICLWICYYICAHILQIIPI